MVDWSCLNPLSVRLASWDPLARLRRSSRFSLAMALMALGLGWHGIPASAQLRLVPEATEQVYAKMPQLPRGSDYTPTSDAVGQGESTLVQRMMQYHMQLAGRPATSRMDWRLTLADYLDINEPMLAQRYPGATSLDPSPYNDDKAAIQSLSRRERYDLVDALVASLGGDPTPGILYIPDLSEPGSVAPPPAVQDIRLPQPGGADLLRIN